MSAPLSKDEFMAHVGYIREDIAGVSARLDTLNGRTRKVEVQTAVQWLALGLIGSASAIVFVWALGKF